MGKLKAKAKKLFFEDVTHQRFREDFIKVLEEKTVSDEREKGFYCTCCGKFGKELAFPSMNKIVIQENIMIVNTHYDGCQGWS